MGTALMIIAIVALAIATVERHVKTKQLKGYLQVSNETAHQSKLALIEVNKKLEDEKVYSGKLRSRLTEVESATQILLKARK